MASLSGLFEGRFTPCEAPTSIVDLAQLCARGGWSELLEMASEDAAASLIRMRAKLMKDALARTPEPAFLAVLMGTGERAYRRPDGVFVIPVRTHGAWGRPRRVFACATKDAESNAPGVREGRRSA